MICKPYCAPDPPVMATMSFINITREQWGNEDIRKETRKWKLMVKNKWESDKYLAFLYALGNFIKFVSGYFIDE